MIKQTLTLLSIFLISSYRLNPSISGITISIISRSYEPALKFFKANKGLTTSILSDEVRSLFVDVVVVIMVLVVDVVCGPDMPFFTVLNIKSVYIS